jgi:pyruvate,orthophosphate dikinase
MKKKTTKTESKNKKQIFSFEQGFADGSAKLINTLGGKGAHLAEMAKMNIPVPPGFTIATNVCTYYYQNNRTIPQELKAPIKKALARIEKVTRCQFGNPTNPLLVSVRSGARRSMPGMMETVLNVGLNESTVAGLIAKTNNPRFVYDSQRRFITMYADVVMEKAAGVEVEDKGGIRWKLETILHEYKNRKGVQGDTDLTADDLKEIITLYKAKVQEVFRKQFPEDPYDQLYGAIKAVFAAWNGKRAISYRRIENIPDDWGTAVTVQAMAFGNYGETSATGVGFTRNPATGEDAFYGEWLQNAQGEDVVSGSRTPNPINDFSKNAHNINLQTLEQAMPKVYADLVSIRKRLERHYRDMLDIEFTVENARLWILQCRVGKRNGTAAVKIALDMYRQKLITKEMAVGRVTADQLDELLHPIIDPKAEKAVRPLAKGLPAGPGAGAGQVVFTAQEAVNQFKLGKKVILVREETNPEDVEGMRASEAILTARGGMTSHAALVARGWGKCCIVGASELIVNTETKTFRSNGTLIKEGDWITLNGSQGLVYSGELPMIRSDQQTENVKAFIELCHHVRRLKIRANADTPEDAMKSLEFGAEGIGLFRTEHMFYGKNSEEPLFLLRKMIMAKTPAEKQVALDELFPFVKRSIKETLAVMDGLPVTIRTLDPPLHEFIPSHETEQKKMADSIGISMEEFSRRADVLHENNPMMGHRGVRLGITHPEITAMQVRAIFEGAAELMQEGKKPLPEIMIPVVGHHHELKHQSEIVKQVYAEVLSKFNIKKIPHLVGTMIEVPRATLTADELAETAEFFSFGTNDLTQLTFGFSRDDIGTFLPEYFKKNIISKDPFQTIDKNGIGPLMEIAVVKGRKIRPKLKIGICGEHGGDYDSVGFCHDIGLDYVSCSPYRIPVAHLAAAQAALREKENTN